MQRRNKLRVIESQSLIIIYISFMFFECVPLGKIKELFIPGIIMTITVSVLVNAIYFKANWNYKFDKTKTVKRGFRLNQVL